VQCACFGFLVLAAILFFWPRMYYIDWATGQGHLWIHIGWGRFAVFVRNEPGTSSLSTSWGSNYETNEPSIFFSPRDSLVELPGFEYVAGTYYTTVFAGSAVAVSWFYMAVFGLTLVLWMRWPRRRNSAAIDGAKAFPPELPSEAALPIAIQPSASHDERVRADDS